MLPMWESTSSYYRWLKYDADDDDRGVLRGPAKCERVGVGTGPVEICFENNENRARELESPLISPSDERWLMVNQPEFSTHQGL